MRVSKRFLVVGLILALTTTVVAPAMAEDPTSYQAQVTVNEIISFTVVDNDAAAGINFGNVNAGVQLTPEAAQLSSPTSPAVTLVINGGTNVNCVMQVGGSGDFSAGPGLTMALSQAKWHTENMASGAYPISTTYADVALVSAGQFRSQDVYHWLTVPAETQPGTYTTTFYYRAAKQ